jgi:leucyl aminopeptidase
LEIQVKMGSVEREAADAVVVWQFEGEGLVPEAAALDRRLRGLIREVVRSGEFTGRLNQTVLLHTHGRLPAKRILLVGLGKRKEFGPDRIRQAVATATRHLRDLGIKRFSAALLGKTLKQPSAAAQALAEGAILGSYRFDDYRTENREDLKTVEAITVVDSESRLRKALEDGVRRGRIIAEAANYARDLSNHPSNVATPSRLAQEAQTIAANLGLSCTVLERLQMESLGMGAYLGVARGSEEPPKFIILEYHGDPKARPVALVGKTITFDSGGISIKPADNMEKMKADMAGGAAVLAVVRAAAQLKLPVSVVGLLPATENMPSGTAIKPGDVIKTLSGMTVEVINTDAEGRLALADGLAYALRFKPSAVVDLATLTGAATVALGHAATPILGNNARLMDRIRTAGERSGERVWELPLWPEYYEQIKSDVADLRNVGGRPGGTITAAAFLSKFVDDTPWAHLDIAATSWTDEPKPYIPKGSTGVGVRLLMEFLSGQSGSRS